MRSLIPCLLGCALLAGAAVRTISAPTIPTRDEDPLVCATCVGSSNCSACKNCSSCAHCKKRGGTCGVCK